MVCTLCSRTTTHCCSDCSGGSIGESSGFRNVEKKTPFVTESSKGCSERNQTNTQQQRADKSDSRGQRQSQRRGGEGRHQFATRIRGGRIRMKAKASIEVVALHAFHLHGPTDVRFELLLHGAANALIHCSHHPSFQLYKPFFLNLRRQRAIFELSSAPW